MADLRVIDADPVGQGIVERLEQVLEWAHNDELSSVAIAVVRRDGSPDWHWSRPPNQSTLIGAVERMKLAMIRAADAD